MPNDLKPWGFSPRNRMGLGRPNGVGTPHFYDDMFPRGTLVKVLNETVDPFKTDNLKKGTLVTVDSIDYANSKDTWVLCSDQSDQSGTKWALRPRDLERVDMNTEKVGRFRILAMDSMIDNQNKTQE